MVSEGERAPDSRAWVGTVEAARYLDVSQRTLANWRVRGGGPPFAKFGHLAKYKRWLKGVASIGL